MRIGQLWGQKITNPVGLAAGFDKDGEAIDGMSSLVLSSILNIGQVFLILGSVG